MNDKSLKNMSLELPERQFDQMRQSDIMRADTSDWIAVLPLGATEQHGPHLPAETDTLIVRGLVKRLTKALPETLKITFLPVEAIGYSPEHGDWKQTKTFSYDEAIGRWIAIGEKLATLGIKKMLLLNAHGGNSPLLSIVATELRRHFDMLCVATSWTRFGLPKGPLPTTQAVFDIHGGFIETSMMLALHPGKVEMKKAENFSSFQSDLLAKNKHLTAYGKHGFGWKMQDLNPKGVVGNAGAANAAAGEKILAHAIKGLSELLDDMHRFDLTHFERKPE